jgi:hypothetical protein
VETTPPPTPKYPDTYKSAGCEIHHTLGELLGLTGRESFPYLCSREVERGSTHNTEREVVTVNTDNPTELTGLASGIEAKSDVRARMHLIALDLRVALESQIATHKMTQSTAHAIFAEAMRSVIDFANITNPFSIYFEVEVYDEDRNLLMTIEEVEAASEDDACELVRGQLTVPSTYLHFTLAHPSNVYDSATGVHYTWNVTDRDILNSLEFEATQKPEGC